MSHVWAKEDADRRGWLYAYRDGNKSIVVNRLGEVIHRTANYADALAWANDNEALIDEPLTRTA